MSKKDRKSHKKDKKRDRKYRNEQRVEIVQQIIPSTEAPSRNVNDSCKTKCDTDLRVDVDVTPKVCCQQTDELTKTSFDIEVDIKSRPSCCIREKTVNFARDNKCSNKCFFTVDVEVDFECKTKVTEPTRNPYAKYDLDVKIDTESSCQAAKTCC